MRTLLEIRAGNWRGRNLPDGLLGMRRGPSGDPWVLNASQVAVENGHGALISVDVERERCWKIRARNWWRQNLRDALFGIRRGAPGDARVLSVSQVAVENDHSSPISVDVERAVGEKCERYWKYALEVGGDELREILGSSHAA